MKYPTPDENEIIDVWLFLLPILSLSIIKNHEELLEIDFDLDEKTVDSIRNFTISCLESIKFDTVSISEAWIAFFMELEEVAREELIYNWVSRRIKLREGITDNFRMLDGWNVLLLRWSENKLPIHEMFTGLEIENELKLREIMLLSQIEKESFQLYKDLNTLNLSLWDNFLINELNIHIMACNCVYDVIELRKWKNIFFHLNDSRIQILDVWGNISHKENGWDEIHLSDIANLILTLLI